ncbi:MAG: TSCPD domain-containing protein [Candidatus Enteromonas sp.]|nr:TSCPD domain-containing protein [Candidatus Enteromonas sp.]
MNEKTYIYHPKNVCSLEMRIVYDADEMRILSYLSVRGCPGNSQGLGRALVGMKIQEAKDRLSGIRCPGSRNKMTSCPDQLSLALGEILLQENAHQE